MWCGEWDTSRFTLLCEMLRYGRCPKRCAFGTIHGRVFTLIRYFNTSTTRADIG